MGRTYKDSRSKKTTNHLLEVRKNDNSTYEVFWKGSLVRSEVPEHFLDAVLCVKYGFCGEELEAIIRQLDESGKAVVVL